MAFFVGHTGMIRLRRRSSEETELPFIVQSDDINTLLNRLYFEGSEDNILTGDQLFISTDDSRGLAFLAPSAWPTSNIVQKTIRVYVNVNAMGGLRFFDTYIDAVNNNRDAELSLVDTFGAEINASIIVRDGRYNPLGSIVSYELNTDREAIDTTSLSDKFRKQYSAGLISGNGSIECLFDYRAIRDEETPLFLMQTIQRLEVGSELGMILSLTPPEGERINFSASSNEVFYELQAVITRVGFTASADALINCSIDFLTTGSFAVRVGIPNEYILKEDFDLIEVEEKQKTGLGYLLQEVTD